MFKNEKKKTNKKMKMKIKSYEANNFNVVR